MAAIIGKELKITLKEAFLYRKILASKGNLRRKSRTANRVIDTLAEAHFKNIVTK